MGPMGSLSQVDGKRILREVSADIYIVTDLMETDLHRVIYSKQPLTEEHHQYFVHQVLRGLAYLHSASIVHRDIKPSNLLVNKNCDLKICDFGLARVLAKETDEAAGRTDYVVTRWYRAPEVMLYAAEYTVAIDVWAPRLSESTCKDHVDQLRKIVQLLGSPTEADLHWLPQGGTARGFLAKCEAARPVNWKHALSSASDDAIEVVSKMMTFDPTVRISVADTLRLKYFDHLFDEEDMVHDTCNKKIDWSFDNFEPTKPAPGRRRDFCQGLSGPKQGHRPFLSSSTSRSALTKMLAKHFLSQHSNDALSTKDRRKFRRRHSLSYKQIEAFDCESAEELTVSNDRPGACFIWLKFLF
eukprot:Skav235897  [mRNA]  locus=scaffold256:54700:70467:+ [translate_table: standard]